MTILPTNRFALEVLKQATSLKRGVPQDALQRSASAVTNYHQSSHKKTFGDKKRNSKPICENWNDASGRQYHSLNEHTPFNLCFLRHGQSTWNRDNRFIGWTDTPLTDDGVLEARVAGQMLAKSGILFDEVHTSLLRRSIRTANLVLMEMGQEYIPVYKHWRLNERNYGELVGKNKKEVVMKHGADQVKRWRRSYDEPPPPMTEDHEYHPNRDPRYRLMHDKIPLSESLKCTKDRSSVYWDKVIQPSLEEGKTVLIVGHENNLRSLIMRLEDIPEQDIINLNLPRAVPLAYRLDENFKPLDRPDGKLDEATGFLRGEWLGGDKAVAEILERDHKQVYDTTVTQNLELGSQRDSWNNWMEFVLGKPSPEAAAKGCASGDGKFVGSSPVPQCDPEDLKPQRHPEMVDRADRKAA